MKKSLKKVSLAKETILRLTPMDLSRGVRGGNSIPCTTSANCPPEGWSEQSVCYTTTPSDCKPCN